MRYKSLARSQWLLTSFTLYFEVDIFLFHGSVFNYFRIAVMADSTSSLSHLYSELKKNHDEAYFMIDEAIKLEIGGKQSEVC